MIDVVKLFKEAALEVDNRKLDEVSSTSIISGWTPSRRWSW